MSGVNDDLFIITSNNKTPQSLNRRWSCLPLHRRQSSQLTQGGGSKVRRPCQSTIVGGVCTELRHSDRNLRTAWFEKEDFKIGIKKKHWVDFYHYRMDVYTHFQHTFMFKQHVKWILQKKHWVDFYHYRMDVYTHFQHTFMFKQHVKWILHPMTPLKCT